ncbi:hypothetical protein [Sporosarcina koreensis]|uniref:Uncharacterized protein n=1 Tax=Sporosarcina koreensis TaxID=334735 RepID=A0ABW0U074_9BACL
MIKKNFFLLAFTLLLGTFPLLHPASAASQLDEQGTLIFGTLHYLDKNGRYLTIKRDNGKLENYFFQRSTQIRNDKGFAGSSALIEGDRIKLQFQRAGSVFLDKVEIMKEEREVKSIRKGKIHLLDSVAGKLNISDGSKFDTYWWGYQSYYDRNSTYPLAKEASVYFGDQLINKSQYRYYNLYDAYFITTMQFNKEVVEHVVIQRGNDKHLREEIISINLNSNYLTLKSSEKVYFHEGTIFIRNKRAVDPISITKGDNAFITTDVINGKLYANIVYIY